MTKLQIEYRHLQPNQKLTLILNQEDEKVDTFTEGKLYKATAPLGLGSPDLFPEVDRDKIGRIRVGETLLCVKKHRNAVLFFIPIQDLYFILDNEIAIVWSVKEL